MIRSWQFRRIAAMSFIGLFMLAGSIVVLRSFAAGPLAAFEAESGTVSSGALKQANGSASGGNMVTFTVATPIPSVTSTASPSCNTVSDKLVPGCGAWLGAWSNNYGSIGLRNQLEEHEARIGRQVSVVHSYHGVGSNTLSADDKFFINRANTYLLTNWKPTSAWAQADGSNSTVNAGIDAMADSVKSVAPNKLVLAVFHEPENDVSGGAGSCASNIYVGSTGTPAEYRAMWTNVRNRFDAKGVTNVVWAMNYMGFSKWDCMVKDLWPGNNLVDWVMYDPYPSGSETWATGIGRFYNWLNANSDASHAFSSKPYGLAEWGAWHTNQAAVYQLYEDGKTAIAAGTMPNIKMYTVFDATGIDDSRVGYNDASILDTTEQQKYNSFVQSAGFR